MDTNSPDPNLFIYLFFNGEGKKEADLWKLGENLQEPRSDSGTSLGQVLSEDLRWRTLHSEILKKEKYVCVGGGMIPVIGGPRWA